MASKENKPSSPDNLPVKDIESIAVSSEGVQVEDAAAVFLYENRAEWSNYSSNEAKKILRKIDWRLMPLIIGTITIAAVDVRIRCTVKPICHDS